MRKYPVNEAMGGDEIPREQDREEEEENDEEEEEDQAHDKAEERVQAQASDEDRTCSGPLATP